MRRLESLAILLIGVLIVRCLLPAAAGAHHTAAEGAGAQDAGAATGAAAPGGGECGGKRGSEVPSAARAVLHVAPLHWACRLQMLWVDGTKTCMLSAHPFKPLCPLQQVSVIFLLGGALVLLPAPAPYQSRLQVCTFGVMYALQVGDSVSFHEALLK